MQAVKHAELRYSRVRVIIAVFIRRKWREGAREGGEDDGAVKRRGMPDNLILISYPSVSLSLSLIVWVGTYLGEYELVSNRTSSR